MKNKKKKGFTLIELLAIIVILAIIAVITVPIILNVIDNAKKGAAKDSAYGYKDAVNKYYITKLSENQNTKLDGTYTIEEDGTIKGMDITNKLYTDTYEIEVSGATPTGGYLNYENNVLKDGCLTMDEYKVTIENGEVTTAEIGSCDSISLTACNSSNFNPSPENWFTFDSSTGTITGFSDAWDGTTDITIPCQIDGVDVVNIGNDTNYSGVFASKNLTSVILNDNVITIGTAVFSSNKLTFLVIPNNVEIIGTAAFVGNQITSLTIGKSVSDIKSSAFNGNKLEKITIPSNVKTIGLTAFYSNQLTTVNIEEGVEILGEACFHNNKLTEIVIPNSVTQIGQNAFNNNQLEKITIGKNVSTIGNFAFVKNSSNNPNLTTVYNNTGKAFDWGMIINGSGVATEYNFETGTVVNSLGNVIVKIPPMSILEDRQYVSGEAIGNYGGYNWHVIGDDGENVTLLMDYGELGNLALPSDPNGNLNNGQMAHCPNGEDTICTAHQVSSSTYYTLNSWNVSLIQPYLNGIFYENLKTRIKNDIVSSKVCESGVSYGGYLESEINSVGTTCSKYNEYNVRLITFTEYYNMSPAITSSLPYTERQMYPRTIPEVSYITKVSDSSWLYSESIGLWLTMSKALAGPNSAILESVVNTSGSALTNSVGGNSFTIIRPVITVKK